MMGTYLKVSRFLQGHTLKDISARCNLSTSYLSKIEKGGRKVYDIRVIDRIARAYKVSTLMLLRLKLLQLNFRGE